jgi:hypothetical protein
MLDQEQIDNWDHWDSHPAYPVEDWKYEVANDDTRLGYKEWLKHRLENG